jgi:hypothetical protein
VKVEYTPTVEDVFQLKAALARPLRRHPLLWVFIVGPLLVAAGGAVMAATGAWLWWSLTVLGVGVAGATFVALRKTAFTRQQVEREYAQRAWLHTPFRLELSEKGIVYGHGPFRSECAWQAFAGLLETDHHLILLEKNGPAALAYGMAKRELDRCGGTDAWRRFIKERLSRRDSGRQAA